MTNINHSAISCIYVAIALATSPYLCASFSSRYHQNGGSLPWLSDHSYRYQHKLFGDASKQGSEPPTDVPIKTGLRSFIRSRILWRDRDNDGSKKPPSENLDIHTLVQSPNSAGLIERLSTSSYYPACEDDRFVQDKGEEIIARDIPNNYASKRTRNQVIDSILDDMKNDIHENAKDKIRRVQKGGMTEEEKMIFLDAALMRTSPPKKLKGPPIRQQIPGMVHDDPEVVAVGEQRESVNTKGRSSSKDQLWNAVIGRSSKGTTAQSKSIAETADKSSVTSLILDGKLRSEEAKRIWVDSITNPERFASFSSIQRKSIPSDAMFTRKKYNDAVEEDDLAENTRGNETSVAENEGDVEKSTLLDIKLKRQEDQQNYPDPLKPQRAGEKSVREAVESILSLASRNISNITESALSNSTKSDDLALRLGTAATKQENRDAMLRASAEKKQLEKNQSLIELQRANEAKFLQMEEDRIQESRRKNEQLRLEEERLKEAEKAKLEAAVAKQDEYWANQLLRQKAKRKSSTTDQEKRMMKQRDTMKSTKSDELINCGVADEEKREIMREGEYSESKYEGLFLKENGHETFGDKELTRSLSRVPGTGVKPSNKDVFVSSFVEEQRKKKEEIDRLVNAQQLQLKMLNSPLKAPTTDSTRDPRPLTTVNDKARGLSLSSLTMKKHVPSSKNSPASQNNESSITNVTSKNQLKRPVRQQLPVISKAEEEDDDDLMRSGASGLTVADALAQQRKDRGGDTSRIISNETLNSNDRAKQWGIDMSKFK